MIVVKGTTFVFKAATSANFLHVCWWAAGFGPQLFPARNFHSFLFLLDVPPPEHQQDTLAASSHTMTTLCKPNAVNSSVRSRFPPEPSKRNYKDVTPAAAMAQHVDPKKWNNIWQTSG